MREHILNKKTVFTIVILIIFYKLIDNTTVVHSVASAINPLFFAFFIAFILDRIVMLLERKTGLPRIISILITVLSIVSLMIVIISIGVPQLVDKTLSLIEEFSNINNYELPMQIIGDIQNSYLLEINQYLNSFIEDVVSKFSTIGGEVLNTVVSQILRLTSSMIKFILSFVIAVYMLIDKNDLKIKIKRFNYAFFSIDLADRLVKITREANEIFSSFFIGKLIDSTIIGLLFYVFAITLGIPYAIINALIVGITNMIPYIGPFIGAIPVGIIVLVVSPYKFILTIFLIIALQQFDGLILGPLILGDRLNVSAFWIIVAVSIGGALKGFIGMLFGVPILVLLKTIVEETIETKLESKQLNYIDGTQLQERNNGYIFRRMYRSIKEYFEQ